METNISTDTLLQNSDAARARQLAARGAAMSEKEKTAAKKVAREFEALFAGMMIKSMRETVGKDKLTGGGHGEEVYQSFLDQEYASSMAAHGGLGLARVIERQLIHDNQPHERDRQGAVKAAFPEGK